MSSLVGKDVIVCRNLQSGDYLKNNDLYFSSIYNKRVTIVYSFGDNTYLTNVFVPEFMNENNDYVYHGFLKIMDSDFQKILE